MNFEFLRQPCDWDFIPSHILWLAETSVNGAPSQIRSAVKMAKNRLGRSSGHFMRQCKLLMMNNLHHMPLLGGGT